MPPLLGGLSIVYGMLRRCPPSGFSSYAGLDIGRDNGLVVDRQYEARASYAFSGTVHQVVFDLQPHSLDDEQHLHEQTAMAAPTPGRGVGSA